MIRPVQASDAAAFADIYNHYIDETIVTFEYDRVDASVFEARIRNVTDGGFPWLSFVDPETDQVVGFAYAGKWRERVAYRFVVESAIYLRDGWGGQGIGKRLYLELFQQLRERKFRSVIAGISLPNEASIATHRSMGFRKVGVFEKVGFKFDRWIDVEFWQLEL
ncbi:GNAT family N-acetyltransferase [Mariniblastus fucicola]|uniref:Phosphinothricin N-acetyltransferase n=1 Tax=Mariniblastus fucicola TaxID=980251 RepID=A0A5B9P8H2_9BACT|nr:GNAT family N-acetyltransferase [Mariniblastus fucicola]QEG22654.1 Phosphinothricin N-acetyltransferase [Mariniblastus fucicola]